MSSMSSSISSMSSSTSLSNQRLVQYVYETTDSKPESDDELIRECLHSVPSKFHEFHSNFNSYNTSAKNLAAVAGSALKTSLTSSFLGVIQLYIHSPSFATIIDQMMKDEYKKSLSYSILLSLFMRALYGFQLEEQRQIETTPLSPSSASESSSSSSPEASSSSISSSAASISSSSSSISDSTSSPLSSTLTPSSSSSSSSSSCSFRTVFVVLSNEILESALAFTSKSSTESSSTLSSYTVSSSAPFSSSPSSSSLSSSSLFYVFPCLRAYSRIIDIPNYNSSDLTDNRHLVEIRLHNEYCVNITQLVYNTYDTDIKQGKQAFIIMPNVPYTIIQRKASDSDSSSDTSSIGIIQLHSVSLREMMMEDEKHYQLPTYPIISPLLQDYNENYVPPLSTPTTHSYMSFHITLTDEKQCESFIQSMMKDEKEKEKYFQAFLYLLQTISSVYMPLRYKYEQNRNMNDKWRGTNDSYDAQIGIEKARDSVSMSSSSSTASSTPTSSSVLSTPSSSSAKPATSSSSSSSTKPATSSLPSSSSSSASSSSSTTTTSSYSSSFSHSHSQSQSALQLLGIRHGSIIFDISYLFFCLENDAMVLRESIQNFLNDPSRIDTLRAALPLEYHFIITFVQQIQNIRIHTTGGVQPCSPFALYGVISSSLFTSPTIAQISAEFLALYSYIRHLPDIDNIEIKRLILRDHDLTASMNNAIELINNKRAVNPAVYASHTDCELFVVYMYTSNALYKLLKHCIFNARYHHVLQQRLSRFLITLFHSLNKLPNAPSDITTLHRGEPGGRSDSILVHEKVVLPSFSSTSSDEARARGFAFPGGYPSTPEGYTNYDEGRIFHITSIAGFGCKSIRDLSFFPLESEYLYNVMSIFQVDRIVEEIDTANHRIIQHIHVREVSDISLLKFILWVDDEPNSEDNQRIKNRCLLTDIIVHLEVSTGGAMTFFNQHSHLLKRSLTHFRILTDLKRIEDGTENRVAGITLINRLRQQGYDRQVCIFTSTRSRDALQNNTAVPVPPNTLITTTVEPVRNFLGFI